MIQTIRPPSEVIMGATFDVICDLCKAWLQYEFRDVRTLTDTTTKLFIRCPHCHTMLEHSEYNRKVKK